MSVIERASFRLLIGELNSDILFHSVVSVSVIGRTISKFRSVSVKRRASVGLLIGGLGYPA